MRTLQRQTLASIFCLFVILLAYCHQRDFDSPTPASRLCLLYEFCEHGRLEIGNSIKSTHDKAAMHGKYYSDKAPGTAVAALPGFALGWFMSRWMRVGPHQRLLAASWLGCALSSAIILAAGAALLCEVLCAIRRAPVVFSHRVDPRFRSCALSLHDNDALSFPGRWPLEHCSLGYLSQTIERGRIGVIGALAARNPWRTLLRVGLGQRSTRPA